MVRLTPRGRSVLDAALGGDAVEGSAARRLVRHLTEAGMIHPAGAPTLPAPPSLTSVVPVRNGACGLASLVTSLRAVGEVIVVDDGSTDGSPETARSAGAHVLANGGAAGPAGARNTGLAASDSELVVFVDHDCVLVSGWLDHLLGLFEDPVLALTAPRVRSAPGSSDLARYERNCSPLDLGPHPSAVAPGRRLTFVPSAAIVARRTALMSIGGFDEEVELGEDVDLVWRLVAAGWTVRYAPESEILHRPRATVLGLARQRFQYGRSAAILDRRHPGAAAPLQVATPTLAIWLAATVRGPAVGVACFVGSTFLAYVNARGRASKRLLALFVARGHLLATRQVARVLVREWLPVTAAACVCSRRARRVALAALAVDVLASRRQHGASTPFLSHVALRAVDHAAYAAGLWRGAASVRSAAALRLRIARRSSRGHRR
jgi:mycofactocin system glycosyltransferase